MKIELPVPKGKVDIACFSKPYRRIHQSNPNNEDCVLVLESKGFKEGLAYAPEQGKAYAEQFPNCQVVLVSNGYCYKAYRRGERKRFLQEPYAYLNLLNPQDRYPLAPKKVKGCLEALKLMLPSSHLPGTS